MKQNSEIRIKCTTEEKDKIKSKAEKVGMKIKNYLLYIGLNTELEVSIKEGKNYKKT